MLRWHFLCLDLCWIYHQYCVVKVDPDAVLVIDPAEIQTKKMPPSEAMDQNIESKDAQKQLQLGNQVGDLASLRGHEHITGQLSAFNALSDSLHHVLADPNGFGEADAQEIVEHDWNERFKLCMFAAHSILFHAWCVWCVCGTCLV